MTWFMNIMGTFLGMLHGQYLACMYVHLVMVFAMQCTHKTTANLNSKEIKLTQNDAHLSSQYHKSHSLTVYLECDTKSDPYWVWDQETIVNPAVVSHFSIIAEERQGQVDWPCWQT